MFGKIEGQRLHLAKMYIANYCIALEQQAGSVDVRHVVLNINQEFGLVDANEAEALVSDVQHFYSCLVSQQVSAINRSSYWKWKAMSVFEARDELARELSALKA